MSLIYTQQLLLPATCLKHGCTYCMTAGFPLAPHTHEWYENNNNDNDDNNDTPPLDIFQILLDWYLKNDKAVTSGIKVLLCQCASCDLTSLMLRSRYVRWMEKILILKTCECSRHLTAQEGCMITESVI